MGHIGHIGRMGQIGRMGHIGHIGLMDFFFDKRAVLLSYFLGGRLF
jgi:hypothetical protein